MSNVFVVSSNVVSVWRVKVNSIIRSEHFSKFKCYRILGQTIFSFLHYFVVFDILELNKQLLVRMPYSIFLKPKYYLWDLRIF